MTRNHSTENATTANGMT